MAKYRIEAKRTHWYAVIVEADGEMDAISQLDDWMADDFEGFEIRAEWDFDATKVQE